MPVFNDNGATQVPSATAELAFMETGDNALKNCTPAQLSERLLAIGDFATAAKGVTNGDTHDHSGGDGAQIDHVNLANKGTMTHAQIDAQIPTVDQKSSLAARIAPSASNLMLTEGQGLSHVATLQALRDWAQGPIIAVFVQAHTTAGDGGHGQFRYVFGAAPSTYVDNNGTIIVPTGGNGSAAWLRVYSGSVNVRWFGAKGDSDGTTGNGTNDTAAIQAAITYAVTTHAAVYAPSVANSYRVTSPLNITGGVKIHGDGFTPYIGATGTRGAGSWIYFDHTGKGFNVAAAANALGSGVYFEMIGTVRNQPAPAPGWTPTSNDFDISINNMDVHIRDLMLYNATKGITLLNGGAGRLTIDRLFGHCMQVGLDVDAAYDVVSANGIHFWPFWRDDANIHAYTMANLDAIYLRRCDNPKFTNIFSIFARAGMRFGQNASGRTLKVKVTNADFDRGKYGVWIDNTVTAGVLGMFQNITHQGETGLAQSEFIKIDGNASTLNFGVIRTDLCGASAIDITGANNTVRVSACALLNYNQDVGGIAAVGIAATNILEFQSNPDIGGGGAGPKYWGAGTIRTEDWRTWVPTITAQTGTITTVGTVTANYQAYNNKCSFNIIIPITTNGTGGSDLRFTLPVIPAGDAQCVGREVNISGSGLHVNISNANNVASVITYNNAYPGADGATLIISGSYQI